MTGFRLLPFLVLTLTVATNAYGQAKDQCKPNGCGPGGWLGTIVPNRVLTCNFVDACNNHDICYSRCESCGPLFGRPECEGTCEQKRARKDRCDVTFYDEMIGGTNNKVLCKTPALAYYWAVKYRGCQYFRSLRDALRTRQQFQDDFEAILKWLDENPDLATVESTSIALGKIAELNVSENNRLSTAGGRLVITAEGKGVGPRSSSAGRTERWLLNGIDVSGMEVDGAPFDLDRVTRERQDFDASGLGQQVISTR